MNQGVKDVLTTLYGFCLEHEFLHPHMIIADELINNTALYYEINGIKRIVCEYFNLEQVDIDKITRKREIVQVRQIAHFFAKETSDHFKLSWSLADIGKKIGGKNHATVLHSIKTVKNVCDTDRAFNHKVIAIRDIIRLKFKPEINDKE